MWTTNIKNVNEVYKIIKSKFEHTQKEKICGFVGDLTNMETSYMS